MRRAITSVGLVLILIVTSSCVTKQSRYAMIHKSYPKRAKDCKIEVFRNEQPEKEFIKISRLDVHIEKTHFIGSGFDEALPELNKQACLSGADAIIDIEESHSSHLETKIYHVTATGIKYIQSQMINGNKSN